jgi:hypothetical protein
VLAVASAGPLPALEPRASFEMLADLDSLLGALSEWEERAREAEAEVAAMRWEVRIAGEKLVALVNRLVELENAPGRRARRRLRGEQGRVSPGEIADAAAAEAGEVRPDRA